MKRVAAAVLFVLALGVSTKADSCSDCQTLTVLETLTNFTVVGAPTTVEWLFLDFPSNFEVIDTWQGGMFSGDVLSSHVNIGVPISAALVDSFIPGTPVSEPGTLGLLGLGFALIWRRLRNRRVLLSSVIT